MKPFCWRLGRARLCVRPVQDYVVIERRSRPGKPLLSVYDLWVPLKQRRRGLAHALLELATHHADTEGADLWLYVSSFDNGATDAALMALYRQHGFRAARNPLYENEMVRRCPG